MISPPSLLLVGLVVLAPLLVGAVHPATTAVLAALAVLALTWHVWSRSNAPLAIPWLGWLALALPIWLAVTMVPLPPALVAALDPHAMAWWDTPLLAGVPGPSLSLSPGSTAFEVLKAVALGAAFLLATQIAQQADGRRFLVGGLVLAGLVTLCVSVAQTIDEPERLLWVYAPRHPLSAGFQTPFVNDNHAAQLFELCGFAALGATIGLRGRWFGIAAISGLALLGGVVATGSNGGLVCLGSGALFIVALVVARRGWRWAPWIFVAVALSVVSWTAVHLHRDAGAGASEPLVLAILDAGKLAHLPGMIDLIHEHPVTGVGRGAFHAAFERHKPVGLHARYTHAESEPIQVACELGLPLAALMVAIVALTWVLALARWRGDPAVAGALVAVAVVSWHNLAGFGLEFCGVDLPFAVALGILAATQQRGIPRLGSVGARSLALLLLLPLLLTPLALRHGTEWLELDRLKHTADAELDEVVQRGLRWHPHSAHYTMAVFDRIRLSADPAEVLPYLNRAMFLAPRNATPHVAAAEILAGMGARSQASHEARLALDIEPAMRTRLFPLLAWSLRTPDEVRRYMGPGGERMADFAQYLLRQDRESPLARSILAELSEEDRESPTVARLQAAIMWNEGKRPQAMAILQEASAEHPENSPLNGYYASLLRAQGAHDDALAVVENVLDANPDDIALLKQKVAVEMALARHGEAQRTLNRIRALTVDTNTHQLAWICKTEGELVAQQGKHERARDRFLESLRYRADQPDVRLALGKAYQDMGREMEALEQFRRVREQTDHYPYLDAWIEDLEVRLGPHAH